MKYPFALFICLLFMACRQSNADNQTNQLAAKVDSLQNQLDRCYRPGLGEFMSGIQVHHEKLWFAGKGNNWPLANFELGEIKEALDDAKQFCQDRPEISSMPMIEPALDSINQAISSKDQGKFKNSFLLLTNTCNNCHRATKHEFNVIKIPDTPPFSNQVFNLQ